VTGKVLPLSDLITKADVRRAGKSSYPVLSMTMRSGLVDQADKFKKRVAIVDTSQYRVVARGQLVVGFPIDEGVLSFQRLYDDAIVSPAYEVWDLIDHESIDSWYLERFLRSPRALSFYAAKLRGSTARRRSLPQDVFLSLAVPVPPLPEQRRITDILDRADALRAMRRRAIAQLDELTESVFIDQFSGSEHPTAELGQVATFIRGLTFKPSDVVPLGSPGSIACMRTKNVQAEIDCSDVWAIPASLLKDQTKALREGDILISSANSSNLVGRGCWVPELNWPSTFGGFVMALRAERTLVDPRFLFAWFSSSRAQTQLRSSANKTTNISNLNVNLCRKIRLPLPPLDEQRAFGDTVGSVGGVKAGYQTALAELDELFSSLQSHAFRGDL